MIDFHPLFEQMIEDTYRPLLARYPHVQLLRVDIRPPESEQDHSMGSYADKTVILNGYWFARHPRFLQDAARTPPFFHGVMRDEPAHVLTHEFGHAVEDQTPGCADRVKALWAAATLDPSSAPAEYALANPAEYFAELFALVELGLADTAQREQLRYALGVRH